MKPHLDIRHEGTMGTEGRTRMTFDEHSTAHLMSILTDLYSDLELTVIREYSANAWDSHVAAGSTDPIEVLLPSPLEPTFTVRDHGVGLSADEITRYFSKYGWSSKRDTDAEVGLLGLGCKSGLTYTSQFTLFAVQGGVRTTALITRESDGGGVIQILDTSATDQANGVEVRIPVHSIDTFNRKATEFFRFWREANVLVDGEKPVLLGEGKGDLYLDPDVLLTHSLNKDMIVMGGIAYPIPGSRIIDGRTVVAWVPIGSVDFTPSREALKETKRTKETVAALREFVQDSLLRVAQRAIDDASTHEEAYCVASVWRGHLAAKQARTLRYRGDTIPDRPFSVPHTVWQAGHVDNPSSKAKSYPTAWISSTHCLHVVGYNQQCLTRVMKAKINEYRKANDLENLRTVVLSQAPISPTWLHHHHHVHWDTIRGIKTEEDISAARRKRPAGQDANGRFQILDLQWMGWKWRKVGDGVRFLYVRASKSYRESDLADIVQHVIEKDMVVVRISKLSEPRFLAENPGAMSLEDYAEALAYCVLMHLTPAEVMAVAGGRHSYFRLAGSEGKILDPVLKEMVAASIQYGAVGSQSGRWPTIRSLYGVLGLFVPDLPKIDRVLQHRARNLEKQYPLLAEGYLSHTQPYIDYVNAMYLVSQLGEKKESIGV